MKRLFLAVALLLISATAWGQGGPPSPAPVSVLCPTCQVTLAVSGTSANVQLPSTAASANAITIYNNGAVDAHFSVGATNAVVATTANNVVPAGTSLTLYAVPGHWIAAITATSTTKLVIYQANGPIYFGSNNVTGGTIGDVTVTAPLGAVAPASGVSVTLDTTDAANLAATAALLAATDPCQSVSVAKLSVPIAVSASATTTELVAAVSGKKIYVCRFSMTVTGTTPSVKFETGTKASTPCDTTAVALTGVYAPLTGSVVADGGPGVLMTSALAGEVCLLTGGTTPSAGGVLTYVQQ